MRVARQYWNPIWIVVDGSTDGTDERLRQMAANDAGLRVYVLPQNRGKGAAILHGLREAVASGFTHALTMDSDGQHPADHIPEFMAIARANPDALILGKPVFDASAPRVRVVGRRVSNGWANLETLWAGIGDSLYGFRVYPIQPALEVAARGDRMDFDIEIAVRLVWAGVPIINIPTGVRYLPRDAGGTSHFRPVRDNVAITLLHTRLLFASLRWHLGFVRRLAA